MNMQEDSHPFDEAFGKAVDLGNQIADNDDKADLWDIADGLLAGAVQYWLYSRQPCGDPRCELPADQYGGRAHCGTAAADRPVLGREPVFPRADRRQRRPRLKSAAADPAARCSDLVTGRAAGRRQWLRACPDTGAQSRSFASHIATDPPGGSWS